MRRLFLVALALTVLLPLLAVLLVFLAAAGESAAQCGIPLVATGPVGGVPAADVPLFEGAAARFGLGARGASILAAINYVESTFGTSNLAGVHSGTNSAGAAGPMQFLAGTWASEAVNAPGDPPGQPPNIYDEADAVYSAAHYLHDSGAPGDWPGAIFAYNHSSAYVQQVLSQAQSYYTQGLTTQGSTPSTTTSGAGSTIGGSPFSVPPSSGDPAAALALAPGQPTIVAATYFTDATGAWGDNLIVNHDSYAELSPGIPGTQVTRQNATMLGGLPYMTPLQVTDPQNWRSVILYKRDIAAEHPRLVAQYLERGHRFEVFESGETPREPAKHGDRRRPPWRWQARSVRRGQASYPTPSYEHQRVGQQLAELLGPLARAAGIKPVIGGVDVGSESDYRIPDGGLYSPGASGTWPPMAALVIVGEAAVLRRSRGRRGAGRRPAGANGAVVQAHGRAIRTARGERPDRAGPGRARAADRLAVAAISLPPGRRGGRAAVDAWQQFAYSWPRLR